MRTPACRSRLARIIQNRRCRPGRPHARADPPDTGAVLTRRAYCASRSPSLSSSWPPLSAVLMLSATLVTTFSMSLSACVTASRTCDLRAGLAVVAVEPLSPPADLTIVRPFPMTDFTAPMVSLIRSLAAGCSRSTSRWLACRSSWVASDGCGSSEPTAVSTCETRSPTSRPTRLTVVPGAETTGSPAGS